MGRVTRYSKAVAPYYDDILEAVSGVCGRVHSLDSVSVSTAGVAGQDCQEPGVSKHVSSPPPPPPLSS